MNTARHQIAGAELRRPFIRFVLVMRSSLAAAPYGCSSSVFKVISEMLDASFSPKHSFVSRCCRLLLLLLQFDHPANKLLHEIASWAGHERTVK